MLSEGRRSKIESFQNEFENMMYCFVDNSSIVTPTELARVAHRCDTFNFEQG